MRNKSLMKNKDHIRAQSTEKFKPSNAEVDLKHIMSELLDVQKRYNDNYDIDDEHYEDEIEKQTKILKKDFDGNRCLDL
jgi:hypothetical protein